MTPNQQFVVALAGIGLNTLIAILTYRKAEHARAQALETAHEVNSRIDEFKDLLADASRKATLETIEQLKADAVKKPAKPKG